MATHFDEFCGLFRFRLRNEINHLMKQEANEAYSQPNEAHHEPAVPVQPAGKTTFMIRPVSWQSTLQERPPLK